MPNHFRYIFPALLAIMQCYSSLAIAEGTQRIEDRISAEKKAYENRFVLLPHKINYILPFTYQDKLNEEPFEASGMELQHSEVKFQLSVKMPVSRKTLFANNGYIYAAYTAQSFFQAYNFKESSPFRDINHEAELMVNFTNEKKWHDIYMPLTSVGFSHQSNGQRDELSRSWNRLYIESTFHYRDIYLSVKPWWHIPESEKSSPEDRTGDDNPDIGDYYGFIELRAFKQFDDNELGIMVRNNMQGTQRGAVEINYSYPFDTKVKGFVQVFHGYGESLLDYNQSHTSIGFGLMFNNWF